MKFAALLSLFFFPSLAIASSTCNVDTGQPVSGVTMEQSGGAVSLAWQSESGQELRARLSVWDPAGDGDFLQPLQLN